MSQQTPLDDVLRERLQPDEFALYQRLHAAHFFWWKAHRLSVPGSLRGLRSLLHRAGAVSLQRDQVHKTSQPFYDYAAELGLPLDRFDIDDRLTGMQHPGHPGQRYFSEPGDCLAMYANTRLGWVSHGVGNALTFSLPDTLRNCLRDEAREDGWSTLTAYRCPPFVDALRRLEFWSVADFAARLAGRHGLAEEAAEAPIDALAALVDDASDGIDLTAVRRLADDADALLAEHRPTYAQAGEAFAFAAVLGVLLDQLTARITVPNGMNFWYPLTEAALTATRQFLPRLRDLVESAGTDHDRLTSALDELAADCRAYLDAPNARHEPGPAWRDLTEATADHLRALGFAMRRHRRDDVKNADTVFTASNALWRWVFFHDHRRLRPDLEGLGLTRADRDRAAGVVLRWLHRPWAVLSAEDVGPAFRGMVPGDEENGVQRAFMVLGDLLRSEPGLYLQKAFNVADPDRAGALLLRLIDSRYVLHACRQRVQYLRFEDEDDNLRVQGRLLIEMFTAWAYGDDRRMDRLEDDMEDVVRLLRDGAPWCQEFLNADRPVTTRQRTFAAQYQTDPEAWCKRLFRFDDPGFFVDEHLGFMPPERFSFLQA
ncbi:hypothetical protein ACFPIJ_57865 [Dactylosporangium cerinum]|uniref:Uncharacterized protein n=1 Tax=Dactylosporangium cerinum TaxID=1434730 RepID=A0ABV9WFE5_9ACTN